MEPSPTQATAGENADDESSWAGVPVAAVLCVCLTVFLFAVIVLLCIRKILQRRGIYIPNVSCGCCNHCCVGRCDGGRGGCGEVCISIAERLDCNTPNTQVCLDHVCPSKQACSLWCGQLWSCYACHMMREQCRSIPTLCPACSVCECPDCQCCGHCCHCKLKAPDCTHINCLCCDLDCGNDEDS